MSDFDPTKFDYYARLLPDGSLTDIQYRPWKYPNDICLSECPPSPRPGVKLYLSAPTAETLVATPIRPSEPSERQVLQDAIAVKLSGGWGQLTLEDQNKFQAIIDTHAEKVLNPPEVPVDDSPLVYDFDTPPVPPDPAMAEFDNREPL